MDGLFRKKWVWILAGFLVSAHLPAQGTRVPTPKTEAEIREMMKITYNQNILPPGARKETLEGLLELGQVIVFYDHPPVVPWMSAAGIMVNAPAETVFNTLTDYPHYSGFIPMTKGATKEKVGPNLYNVSYDIQVNMVFFKYGMQYGVYHYDRPPFRTDWSHSWGEFNINVGFWELIPTADGTRTMAFYSVHSEPRGKFLNMLYSREPVLEVMTNVMTATMVTRAVKSEAEKRYRAGGGKCPAGKKGRKIFDLLAEDPASMKKFLERGKLLVLEDGPTVYVTSGTITPVSRDQAWRVITDFQEYPRFMPAVKKVEFLEKGEKGPRYFWEIAIDLMVLNYSYNYQAEYVMKPPESITWNMTQENAQSVTGFWRLVESEDKTLLFNGSTADLRKMGAILSYALKVEPTLEHAILGCQSLVNISTLKSEIEKQAKARGR